jgi:hypothetical protein
VSCVTQTPTRSIELADRINAEHAACIASACDAVKRAIEVGRLLAEAKEHAGHGQWSGWVKEHCVFGVRQSQKYMRAYENRAAILEQIRTESSHLGVSGATALIAKPRAVKHEPVTSNNVLQKEESPQPFDELQNDKGFELACFLSERMKQDIKAYREAIPGTTDDVILCGLGYVHSLVEDDDGNLLLEEPE